MNIKKEIVKAQETDTELVLRRWKNTSRLFKNKAAQEAVKIEKESTTGKFEEVAPWVSGKRGRQVFINGDPDFGVRNTLALIFTKRNTNEVLGVDCWSGDWTYS